MGEIFIRWYREHGRDLPWRKTTDPYLIWVSEVILQQTRVVQGLDYYYRFTERFPDIQALAAAEEDEVLRYWQGLGYYSRARNMHQAARDMMNRFQGAFPRTHSEVLSLKGVGEYTAAAVCSFAYNQPYATVDGNVFRVLSRLFGIDKPIDTLSGKRFFTELATELMPRQAPGEFNQAVMEFGALQCTPQSPECARCPLSDRCVAREEGRVNELPVKQGKVKPLPRYFNYLQVVSSGRMLLAKRTQRDIWQNLYEFPLIETDIPIDFQQLQEQPLFCALTAGLPEVVVTRPVADLKHVLTHRIIYASFFRVEVPFFSPEMERLYRVISCGALDDYAVPRLIQRYLENLGAADGNI